MSAQEDLYDSLLEDINALTARPDLEAEAEVALRTATLSAHMGATYLRDIVTMPVRIPNASYLTAIDMQVALPRARGIAAVQLLDTEGNPIVDPEIEVVEFGDIYDPLYGGLKNNIAYAAGTSLNVRSSVPASGYNVSYYQLPLVKRSQYNSWIGQLAPDSIIYGAASIVLATNGNEEKAAAYAKAVATMYKPMLEQSFQTTAQR